MTSHHHPGDAKRVRSLLPYAVTAFVVLCVWVWQFQGIGAGDLSHFDEFYTYDRSTGFARQGDWLSVYSLNWPTIKKPPLQYWLSGLLIEAGVRDLVALRLPSMLFALGAFAATVWLMRIAVPDQPWAILPAAVFLAASPQFWWHANSAMLDSGAVFFTTLGFASILCAVQWPRFWPVFTLVTALAALQKSATPLAFLGLTLSSLRLTRRWQGTTIADIWAQPAFRRALWMSLCLAVAWPFLQYLRGLWGDAPAGSLPKELVARFAPSIESGAERGPAELWRLIIGGEPVLRIAGFAGLFALPLVTRRPILWILSGMGALFVVLVLFASGQVYDRYALLILPLLAVGLSGTIMTMATRSWVGLAFAFGLTGFAALTLALTPVAQRTDGRSKFAVPLADLLEPVSRDLRPEEALVICAFGDSPRIPPGAASVFASNGERFAYLFRPNPRRELRKIGRADARLRGICRPGELDAIASDLADLNRTPLADDRFVYWTASGLVAEGN